MRVCVRTLAQCNGKPYVRCLEMADSLDHMMTAAQSGVRRFTVRRACIVLISYDKLGKIEGMLA